MICRVFIMTEKGGYNGDLFFIELKDYETRHKLVDELTLPENKDAVEKYKEQAAKQSEIDRQSISKEKTVVKGRRHGRK